MRLIACLTLLVLLAACGTATPTPTATLPIPTETPNAAPTNELSELALTIAVPIPGTLVYSQNNLPPIDFTVVTFTRTGGIAGETLNIEINQDGTLVRNETESSVSPDVVSEINDRLNTIHFYNLQGTFNGPVMADAFSYSLTVASDQGSRTISAQDGFIPPELLELFGFFAGLGE